jgi:nicotinic acid mononucleotide adenylyltransferase
MNMEKNEFTSREERKSQGRRRVCLMGLSADPPTNAHVEMAKMLSSSLKSEGWDELRIIPVFQHPFEVSR